MLMSRLVWEAAGREDGTDRGATASGGDEATVHVFGTDVDVTTLAGRRGRDALGEMKVNLLQEG